MTRTEEKRQSKKPYHKPNLQVYGNLTDITQTTTHFGANIDSRSPTNHDRTH